MIFKQFKAIVPYYGKICKMLEKLPTRKSKKYDLNSFLSFCHHFPRNLTFAHLISWVLLQFLPKFDMFLLNASPMVQREFRFLNLKFSGTFFKCLEIIYFEKHWKSARKFWSSKKETLGTTEGTYSRETNQNLARIRDLSK